MVQLSSEVLKIGAPPLPTHLTSPQSGHPHIIHTWHHHADRHVTRPAVSRLLTVLSPRLSLHHQRSGCLTGSHGRAARAPMRAPWNHRRVPRPRPNGVAPSCPMCCHQSPRGP
eukprot:2801561-Prymnesium_polylepis.1